MGQTLLVSIAMALVWMIMARQLSIEGFIVGYVLGFAVLMIIRINTTFEEEDVPIDIRRVPMQVFSLIIYGLLMAVDVFRSGVDVSRRILRPTILINPGVHKIATQDKTRNSLIAALSAHAITITPGELVIDFEEDDEHTYMLVHAIDVQESNEEQLIKDQSNRLKLIKRILGYE